MNKIKYQEIDEAWNEAERVFGDDKSTEFMIAWVCDFTGLTHDDIMEYLEERSKKKT